MSRLLLPVAILGAGALALRATTQFAKGLVGAGLGSTAVGLGLLMGARSLATTDHGDDT